MTTLTPWSEVAHRLSVAARLDDTTVHPEPRALPTGLQTPKPPAAANTIPLRVDDRSQASLSSVLARRRSHRRFADAAVPLASVTAALLAAARADAEWSSDENRAGLGLEFFLLANRIDGLERGAYRLDADAQRLQRVPVDLPKLEELILQLELAASPAILVAAGSLLACETRHGVHGYRLLLARSSAALYAGWLAAIAAGALGCLFAGILSPVYSILRSDGFDRAALCALSLGAPAGGADLPTEREGNEHTHARR